MKYLLWLALLVFQEPRDEGGQIEDIVLPLPQFYLNNVTSEVQGLFGYTDVPPPEHSHWHFYFQLTDRLGRPSGPPQRVDTDVFYGKIRGILSYGVKDSGSIDDPEVNAGFVVIMKTLMKYGIFRQEAVEWAKQKYLFGNHWVESCYFLEEAAGAQFAENDWKELLDRPYNSGGTAPYFETLARIRLAKGDRAKLKEIADWLDARLRDELPDATFLVKVFNNYFKAYAELTRQGVLFRKERAAAPLFDLYFDIDPNLAGDFQTLYRDWGLPAPQESDVEPMLVRLAAQDKVRLPLLGHFRKRGLAFPKEKVRTYLVIMVDVIENAPTGDFEYIAALAGEDLRKMAAEMLTNRLKSSGQPLYALVPKFRELRLEFPKAYAIQYRNEMLDRFGTYDFADIEYLFQFAGTDGIEPEKLKSYGDSAMDWHFNKLNANRQKDPRDYYHAAVECYRLVGSAVKKLEAEKDDLARKYAGAGDNAELEKLRKRIERLTLSPERIGKLLEDAGDLAIRMRDLILAYEFRGNDPKTDELVLAKLRDRTSQAEQRRQERFSFGPGYLAWWRENTPQYESAFFREEIELVARLQEPGRTHALAVKIADALVEQLKREGEEIIAEFTRVRCIRPVGFETYRQRLEDSDGVVYAVFQQVTDLMVYLDFRDGLRAFAQALHDAAWDYSARKIFQLAGLGREAEEKYYGRHDIRYWMARERRFNYEMRTQGTFDPFHK